MAHFRMAAVRKPWWGERYTHGESAPDGLKNLTPDLLQKTINSQSSGMNKTGTWRLRQLT